MGRELKTTEKYAFYIALRRLVAIHGRLPKPMIITEGIEVSDELHPSGGYADVRAGTYKGCLVVMKTMRLTKQDDSREIRKVSVNGIFSAA